MPRPDRPPEPDAPDASDPRQVDALYGLEPVFEPDEANAGSLAEFVTIHCPYCGESFDTRVDLSGGSFSYVEDCQVCCQPIEIGCEVGDDGRLADVRAARLD